MYEVQSVGLVLAALVAFVAAWMFFVRVPRRGVFALRSMRQTQLKRLMGVGLAIVLVVFGIRSFQGRGVDENVVYDRAAYFYQGREVQVTSQKVNETAWGKPVTVTYKLWVQGIGAIEGKCSQPNIFMSPRCEFIHEQ